MQHMAIVTAAAVTLSGLGVLTAGAYANNAQGPTTAPSVLHTAVNDVKKTARNLDVKAQDALIRSTIADATDAALTQKDMSKLISHFDAASQQRIEKSSAYAGGYGEKLNAEIQTFNNNWKQKYGHSFSISLKNSGEIFASPHIAIQVGTSNGNPYLAQEFLVASGEKTAPATNGPARIALVVLNGASIHSGFQVPLICEHTAEWRIQVPASLTAADLRLNLEKQISALNDKSADWPKDESTAYRHVSDHVLMAIMNKAPAVQSKDVSNATAKPTAQANPPAAKATPVSTATPAKWWQFWRW
jgi:hypothetical protein